MSDTTDPTGIRAQLQQFGQELKSELEGLDIKDDVKQQLGTRLDQKLDELGAKIGNPQTQGQTAPPPSSV